jgi:hypothetical protein
VDDEAGEPLFAQAVQRHGPLAADEMYGYVPALVAGGRNVVGQMARVKAVPHLSILRQLAAPTLPPGALGKLLPG